MIEQESYKSRAVAVRRSARAHVLEIRRARIARRQAAMGAAEKPETVIDEVTEAPAAEPDECELIETAPADNAEEPPNEGICDVPITENTLADVVDDDAIESAAMEELTEATADAAAPELAEEQMQEATSEPQTEDLAAFAEETPAEADDPALDPPEPLVEAEPQADSEPASPAPEETDVEDDAPPGDLELLPGAGPGLIWMLNQCGVFTLADLARQEADELSPKLGVVGQILDVERWISFASEGPGGGG